MLFSCTKDLSMEDPLHPESTNATIDNFEPSAITIVPFVSNEFMKHFRHMNFGLFCNSLIEKCASSGDNHRIFCTRSGVTSATRVW